MIVEKQIEEENLIKHTFRCKPIPPEVIIPRYQSILDKNEERRAKVKQDSIAITKSREAPFDFWLRDKEKMEKKRRGYSVDEGLNEDCRRSPFKANPIPIACSVLIYDKKIKKEEEERAKKTHKEAEISLSKAKMPPRMQKDADRKQAQPVKRPEDEFSFRPQINGLVTAAMFEKKQKAFAAGLQKKKNQTAKVVPQPFKFCLLYTSDAADE